MMANSCIAHYYIWKLHNPINMNSQREQFEIKAQAESDKPLSPLKPSRNPISRSTSPPTSRSTSLPISRSTPAPISPKTPNFDINMDNLNKTDEKPKNVFDIAEKPLNLSDKDASSEKRPLGNTETPVVPLSAAVSENPPLEESSDKLFDEALGFLDSVLMKKSLSPHEDLSLTLICPKLSVSPNPKVNTTLNPRLVSPEDGDSHHYHR